METIIEVGFGCLLLGFILGYSFKRGLWAFICYTVSFRWMMNQSPLLSQHNVRLCMKSSGHFICHLPQFHFSACSWQCDALCDGTSGPTSFHAPLHCCKLLAGHLQFNNAHEWSCK